MRLLHPGIGGIVDAKDIDDLPSVDFKQFKKACFGAALSADADVIESNPFDAGRNYHFSQIKQGGQHFFVLCNAHFPVVAFSDSDGRNSSWSFCHHPELSSHFEKAGRYTVMSPDELRRKITEEDLASLCKAEREQVKYWNPSTIGELIFNHWD